MNPSYTIGKVEFKNGQDFGFAKLSPNNLVVDIDILLQGFELNDFGKVRAKIVPTDTSIKDIKELAAEAEKHLRNSLLGDVVFKSPLYNDTLEFGVKADRVDTKLSNNLAIYLVVGVWVRREDGGFKAGLFFTYQ